MAGKRGGAGRASPRAAKARRADEPAVAAARRAALDGELDETMALRLFLAGGDRGKCGRTCKGNAKRVDCVCGLVPPVDGFRRTGLWRRDTDALVSEAVGVNPSTLARASRAVPVGLRNLGNTCYVNAAIQCVFAIPSFRERVLALDPGDDPSVAEGAGTRGGVSTGADTVSAGADAAGASHDGARASAPEARAQSPPSDDENKNATAALRLLFASMVAGDRAVADPRRFADALSLETAAQQDGQEFLKLLLAYLERVAARGLSASAAKDEPEPETTKKKAKRSDARTFIAEHFRGQYTYATTCSRCGCASEASSREVDFYELELNVSDPTRFFDTGPAAGRDAPKKTGSANEDPQKKTKLFGLRDALRSFLAVERLEGDNQYQCGRCCILTDATRAVKLQRLPRYLAFQLKRFVFDLETFERRKCADAFQFPGEVNMADFVRRGDVHAREQNADDLRVDRPTDESSHSYALRSILLHRGQNATSGHYVALVRAASEPGEDAGGAAAEPSRGEKKNAISPDPRRNPKPEPGSQKRARDDDAWWRFDDEEVTALRGGPFGEPAAKGKDGWTLEPGSYASSDAYLLVYERVDEEGTPREDVGGDGGGGDGAARGVLPADLAAAVSVENESLAAMVATFASRVEEARERIETRKARARRVAEMAAPPRACWDDDDQPPEADEKNAAAREGDPAAGSAADAFGRDSYRFAPRSWLARFCDDTHDPGPMDLRPILCAHGEVDPSKAEATVRISREAFEHLVDAAGAADGGAAAPGVCRRCLRASAALVAGEDAEVTARAEARERLEAWEKRVKAETKEASFVPAGDEQTNASSGLSRAGAAIVSAAWLKKWRAWRRGPPPPALTREGPTSSITCAHGNLKPSANVATVDRDTWSFLVRNPPAKEPEGSEVEPRVIEIDVDDPGPGADAPGETAARAGGGGGGGGGGLAVPAHGTASGSNADARHLEMTSEKGPTARSTAASDPSTAPSVSLGLEWSPARWPVHLASAEACAACVSSRLEAAAAKSSSRELVEIHRAACAALRHPLDPDAVDIEVDGVGGGDGNEARRDANDARFRALPRRWLARWRAFAFAKGVDKHAPGGVSSGASLAWRPSLESLREAVEELFCPHGGLVAACDLRGAVSRKRSGESPEADASLAALEAERTRALRAVFGDGATITSTRKTKPNGDGRTHASGPPVADSPAGRSTVLDGASLRPIANPRGRVELELVPVSALAALEEVLGGRVRAPRCFAATASASDGVGWTFEPATCAACASANARECRGEEESDAGDASSRERSAAVEPYFSALISVRRVRVSPAAFARAFADRAKAIGAKRRRDADRLDRLDADADRLGAREDQAAEKDHAPANRDAAEKTARRARVVKAPSPLAKNKESETGFSVGGAACLNLPRLDPVGRACSLVVDHDYTAWRVKLMALEKLAIHPLDISLFYVTYRRDFSDEGEGEGASTIPDAVFELENATTLREAGVPAGARLALFATATRDPEDLTGLEMPLGPVVWETERGGGDARVGAVAGASARERGFAGTALAGFGE